MIDRMESNEELSWHYEKYKRDVSLLIYKAVPNEENISFEESPNNRINYELVRHVRHVVPQIITDVLTRGKASWCLCVNPDKNQERLFCFRPKSNPICEYKAIPMIIQSRDVGIQSRCIRALLRRLRHSRERYTDTSLLKYDGVSRAIADRWGHALSWTMSDYSAFTSPCLLLNECNRKLLAIKLCQTIENVMNEALSKAEIDVYKVKIPTYSIEELELSKREYIEGKLSDKEFNDLVCHRI